MQKRDFASVATGKHLNVLRGIDRCLKRRDALADNTGYLLYILLLKTRCFYYQ